MDVKIGLIHTARELELDMEDDGTAIDQQVEKALAGSELMIWLTDKKGRRVGVVADKLAYVEVEQVDAPKVVGFSG